MESIVPRYQLPDSWSGKGVCPVCRSSGSLKVAHQSINPDRMECGKCGSAFEMQSGGAHIRLLVLPPSLSGRAGELLETWLLPGKVPTIGPLGTGALEEPFGDLLPPADTTAASRVDDFAADLLPPAPPTGTGPLRRVTGPLSGRGLVTGALNSSAAAQMKQSAAEPPPAAPAPPAARPTTRR